MNTYGSRAERGIGEKTAVRGPFVRAVTAGLIKGWDKASVFEDVLLDNRGTQPDLLLVHPSGRVAIVECKRCSAGQAKKGMFEQALLYSELIRPLLRSDRRADLVSKLARARQSLPDGAVESLPTELEAEADILIAVDRWTGRLNETAWHTWVFLNRALAAQARAPIRVWAVGGSVCSVPNPGEA